MRPLTALQIVLGFIAIFHFVFGAGFMFSVDFQKFSMNIYGGTLDWNVQEVYFIRIIGSFAFVLGYLALIAAINPLKYKIISIAFIEFFILRNICRHLFADELYASLGVSQFTNILTSLFFGFQALLLLFLLWKVRHLTTQHPTRHIS